MWHAALAINQPTWIQGFVSLYAECRQLASGAHTTEKAVTDAVRRAYIVTPDLVVTPPLTPAPQGWDGLQWQRAASIPHGVWICIYTGFHLIHKITPCKYTLRVDMQRLALDDLRHRLNMKEVSS